MRSSTWRLEDLRNVILNLGFVGENLHTRQIFDCKKMFDQYPNASVSMTVTPPDGESYPGTIERDGDLVIWDVRDSDLVAEGDGEIQLVFTQEPHIARSYNARTHICRSQVPTGSIPSGLDDYITRADQLLDQVEDTFPAVEAKYTKPETGIPASDLAAGVIPDPEDLIDDTAGDGDTDKVWSADKSHELLTEINSRPEEKDSSERTADLDISDPDGNVLARFQGGDFEVKNFSTKKALTVVSETTDGDADLYITDEDGNGIFRLHNGHVQTKNFSTDCTEYKHTFVYSNTSGTKTIERFFPAGTTLVFHLADNSSVGSDSISNSKVTYSYKDRSNQTHEIGQERGYNYFVYKLPSDAVSVSVAYGSGLLWGESGTLAFSVFAEATVITKQKVVTLDVNGGKDFTSLRSAVESVASLASEQNPYEIHIYPGTYNVYNDYTDAEIGTAGFVGLMITNGISLIGIGSREQIIISGEISTSTYDATKRNDISTLNIKGNVRVENMTIIAKNIRYAIHDDFVTMAYKIMDKHIYKNLKCIGVNLTTGEITFGAGGSNNRKLYATDCEFEGKFLLHNSNGNDTNYHVYLDNCSTTKFTFPDYNAVNGTYVHLRNCKAMFIELTTVNAPHSQSMFIDGEGTCDAFVSCPSGYIYNTGDCVKVNAVQIQAGYAVKAKQKGYHSSTPHIEVSTDSNIVYGVSIGTDNGSTIVQRHGYINSNTLGLPGLSVGDYLTIDNTGAVVSGGTSANAIAKVVYIDEEGIAYAKLTI